MSLPTRKPARPSWAAVLSASAVLLGLGPATLGCDTEPTKGKSVVESKGAEAKPSSPDPVAATKSVEAVGKVVATKPEPPSTVELGVTQENLDRFVPTQLKGLKRTGPSQGMGVTEGPIIAHGAYIIEDAGDRRFVNVNLMEVVDLEFEKAQFRVGKGESQKDGTLTGQEIDGRLVQRNSYGTPPKSEVIVLLADQIVVRVSVENAKDPDEALAYLVELDLAGLEGLAE